MSTLATIVAGNGDIPATICRRARRQFVAERQKRRLKLPILLPLSHSAPSLPMFPLEFRGEVTREETRVMGLSCSEDPMILA